jgi:putative acetyltransferase
VAKGAGKIVVRAAELADHAGIARLYSDRNAYSGTLQLPFPSKAMWRKRLEDNGDHERTIVATVAGEIVGNIGLVRLSRARRAHVGQIGMGVRDAWQGKGVGSALMQAALDLADNWFGLRRVELTVHADNARAIALYRKFGFVREGKHIAYSLRDGVYVDALSMARITAPPKPEKGPQRKTGK